MEKYKRIRVLGQGSFGKVWLVQDTEECEFYVVKQIESTLAGQERERALREAALLRVLRHPGIVGYREAFVTRSGYICLIMEFADGGDLHEFLMQQRQHGGALLPEKQILRWFAQLCDSLRFLHERNVLHRDIKARNIFLRQNGRVQLGDFGISTVLDEPQSSVSAAVGTPVYASPERVRRRHYGASADIWSLGVVVYELSALRRPFEAETLGELADRIVAGAYDALDERAYSLELRNTVRRMLLLSPAERPTAAELLVFPLLRDMPRCLPYAQALQAPLTSGPGASLTSPAPSRCTSGLETIPSVDLSEVGPRALGPRRGAAEALGAPPLPPPSPDAHVPEMQLPDALSAQGSSPRFSPKEAWHFDDPTHEAQRGHFGHTLLDGARRFFGLRSVHSVSPTPTGVQHDEVAHLDLTQ